MNENEIVPTSAASAENEATVSETVFDINNNTTGSKTHIFSPVFRLRILLCAAAAVFLLAVKLFGGEVYDTVREFYVSLESNSIVTDFTEDNSEFLRTFNDLTK